MHRWERRPSERRIVNFLISPTGKRETRVGDSEQVVDSEAHVQGKPGRTKIQSLVSPITEKQSRTLGNTSPTPISRLNLHPYFLEASLSTCPSRYIVLYMSIRDPLSWVACELCGVATRLPDGVAEPEGSEGRSERSAWSEPVLFARCGDVGVIQ